MHVEQYLDRIRERAYAIWEAEGRPEGRDFDHWERAMRELTPHDLSAATATAQSMAPPAPKRRSVAKGKSRMRREPVTA